MNKLRVLPVDYRADGFIDKNSMNYVLVAVLMSEQARHSDVTVNAT